MDRDGRRRLRQHRGRCAELQRHACVAARDSACSIRPLSRPVNPVTTARGGLPAIRRRVPQGPARQRRAQRLDQDGETTSSASGRQTLRVTHSSRNSSSCLHLCCTCPHTLIYTHSPMHPPPVPSTHPHPHPAPQNQAEGSYNESALSCSVALTIPARMVPPIFIYYELDGVYQNHRRWVWGVGASRVLRMEGWGMEEGWGMRGWVEKTQTHIDTHLLPPPPPSLSQLRQVTQRRPAGGPEPARERAVVVRAAAVPKRRPLEDHKPLRASGVEQLQRHVRREWLCNWFR